MDDMRRAVRHSEVNLSIPALPSPLKPSPEALRSLDASATASFPMPYFEYRPLASEPGAIRLLRLLPDQTTTNTISCEIFDANLQAWPVYVALSYCWGSNETPYYLSIRGSSLPITASLYTALKAIGPNVGSTSIWADAVCINQSDVSEKNAQVAQMRRIYENATHTISWLGPAEDKSDLAIVWLRNFSEQIRNQIGSITDEETVAIIFQLLDNAETGAEIQPHLSAIRDSLLELEDRAAAAGAAIAALLNRAYWQRMWIILEVCFSKTLVIQCGASWISKAVIRLAVHFVSLYFFHYKVRLRRQPSFDYSAQIVRVDSIFMITAYHEAGIPIILMRLLDRFAGSKATLGQDRVFSLLGIACDSDELGITADYSLSERDVLILVARRLIRSGYIESLYLAGAESCDDPDDTNIPSWVTYWHKDVKHRSMLRRRWDTSGREELMPNFRACGDLSLSLTDDSLFLPGNPPSQTVAGKNDILTLSAIRVGTITKIGHKFNPAKVPGFLLEILEIARECIRSTTQDTGDGSEYSEAQSVMIATAVVDTMRAGADFVRSDSASVRRIVTSLPPISQWANGLVECLRSQTWGTNTDYLNAVIQKAMGMRPMQIELNGEVFVGIVGTDTAIGDEVVVFGGGPLPLVVRAKQELGNPAANGTYTSHSLIGECYVHGSMDGEIVQRRGSQTFPLYLT